MAASSGSGRGLMVPGEGERWGALVELAVALWNGGSCPRHSAPKVGREEQG